MLSSHPIQLKNDMSYIYKEKCRNPCICRCNHVRSTFTTYLDVKLVLADGWLQYMCSCQVNIKSMYRERFYIEEYRFKNILLSRNTDVVWVQARELNSFIGITARKVTSTESFSSYFYKLSIYCCTIQHETAHSTLNSKVKLQGDYDLTKNNHSSP